MSFYLRCHRYGNIRGDLHNLENVARPGSKSGACGCKFMITRSIRKPGERPWTVRVFSVEKGRNNHSFFMYRDGQIRVNRITVDIRQHIRDLSTTGMQPAFIMTSIRRNFPGFFASMNQIYNVRQSIRREEMKGRTPLQHCLYGHGAQLCSLDILG